MTANGVYAMSVITALTAQNTKEITGITEISPQFLEKQLDSIFSDIFPDAVKIGMIPSAHSAEVIAAKLKHYKAVHIVADPVMISTSGSRLMEKSAVETVKRELFPLAELITPNIAEISVLADMTVNNKADMETAAKIISEKFGCAVLCKGGHRLSDADDLLVANNKIKWFSGKRIFNKNNHGTGCTLSSAIASNLAKGMNIEQSAEIAKEYISGAISAMLDLGSGCGPINHMFGLNSKYINNVKE